MGVRGLRARLTILVATLAAFWVLFLPSRLLRDFVLQSLGNPPYRGPWITFEHIFLFSTLCAATCALVWTAFARRGLLPPVRDSLRFDRPWRIVAWGVAGGVAIAAFNMAVFAVLASQGALEGFSIEYVPPNGWDILGNVFSNFYEEFIARGFLLIALRAVFGNTTIPVVLTSIAFGLGHDQYPVFERCVIALAAALQCVIFLRTRSLWSTWITHEVYDLLLDCAVKIG